MTRTDYSLWGYVKPQVYADKPHTIRDLEVNMCRVMGKIHPQPLEMLLYNLTTIFDFLRGCNGVHMPEIIVKHTVV